MTDQPSLYLVELRQLLQVLDGGEGWQAVAERDELDEVLARAEQAVARADVDVLRRATGDLIRLRPRLAGLGEAPGVAMPAASLPQIADLVHRVRVALGADELGPVAPVEAEVRERVAEAE